jgi:putative aldouronate transport system substrate-binding protein
MKKAILLLTVLLLPILAFAGGSSQQGTAGQAGKPVEITVEVFDRGTDGGKSDPTNNNWTKWIQEKLLKDENISVTFVRIPRGDEIPALNNLMAAGNPPDVCFTYTSTLIDSYVSQGGVFDMSPYTNTLLKDLNAFLGPDPATGKDLSRRYEDLKTGALYYIPARRVDTASSITFIRKDWLDALGLPPPSTTEEFYNAMAAFKEKDPGKVGRDKVIPLTMMATGNAPNANIISNSFIDPNISDKDRWLNSEFTQPGVKEGFRFLNRMYNADLIDRDFPLYNDEQAWYNLIKAGTVGAFTELWQRPISQDNRILAMLKENIPGAELIAIDPFKNGNGITRKGSYDVTGVFWFVPKSSKNPEAAMRYVNWLARFENLNFLQIGPEGITHDLVDGIPRMKTTTGPWIMNAANNMDYTIPVNGLDLGSEEKNARALAFSYPEASPEWIVNTHALTAKNARPDPFVPVTLTAGQPYVQTLVDKGTAIRAQVIRANPADFDRIWDALVADYMASGGQAVLNEKIAKYAEVEPYLKK